MSPNLARERARLTGLIGTFQAAQVALINFASRSLSAHQSLPPAAWLFGFSGFAALAFAMIITMRGALRNDPPPRWTDPAIQYYTEGLDRDLRESALLGLATLVAGLVLVMFWTSLVPLLAVSGVLLLGLAKTITVQASRRRTVAALLKEAAHYSSGQA